MDTPTETPCITGNDRYLLALAALEDAYARHADHVEIDVLTVELVAAEQAGRVAA